jgi:hypothetical protein
MHFVHVFIGLKGNPSVAHGVQRRVAACDCRWRPCTVQVIEQCSHACDNYREMEKINLVPQLLIGSIAPSIGFKLLILCDCVPVKNSMLALNLRASFILVPDFQFMLFDPQLTIKLSIVSNWTPDFA